MRIRTRGARCSFWGAGWWPGTEQPCREVHANSTAPACLGPTFLPLPAMPPTPHTPPSCSPCAAGLWVPRPALPCPGRLWCPASPAAVCQAWHSSLLLLCLPQACLQLPGTVCPAPAPSHLSVPVCPAPAPSHLPGTVSPAPSHLSGTVCPAPAPSHLPGPAPQGCPWGSAQCCCRNVRHNGHKDVVGSRAWVGTGWSPCMGRGFSIPRQRAAQGGTPHPPRLVSAVLGTHCVSRELLLFLFLLFSLKNRKSGGKWSYPPVSQSVPAFHL